jgi:ribonuclease III
VSRLEPSEATETTGEGELRTAVEAFAGLIDSLPEDLAKQALTHPSWVQQRSTSYERLAFLGDSVLGLALAAEVFRRFAAQDSGRLTKILNQSVSGSACAEVGRAVGVPQMLRDSAPSETGTGIPVEVLIGAERPLPEITEALIGACFVAHGFERTAAAVASAFEPQIEFAARTRVDFKSALQELLARRGARVTYAVLSEAGPPHARTFEVAAMLDGKQVGRGEGRSKKIAEQAAAEEALERLGG